MPRFRSAVRFWLTQQTRAMTVWSICAGVVTAQALLAGSATAQATRRPADALLKVNALPPLGKATPEYVLVAFTSSLCGWATKDSARLAFGEVLMRLK